MCDNIRALDRLFVRFRSRVLDRLILRCHCFELLRNTQSILKAIGRSDTDLLSSLRFFWIRVYLIESFHQIITIKLIELLLLRSQANGQCNTTPRPCICTQVNGVNRSWKAIEWSERFCAFHWLFNRSKEKDARTSGLMVISCKDTSNRTNGKRLTRLALRINKFSPNASRRMLYESIQLSKSPNQIRNATDLWVYKANVRSQRCGERRVRLVCVLICGHAAVDRKSNEKDVVWAERDNQLTEERRTAPCVNQCESSEPNRSASEQKLTAVLECDHIESVQRKWCLRIRSTRDCSTDCGWAQPINTLKASQKSNSEREYSAKLVQRSFWR